MGDGLHLSARSSQVCWHIFLAPPSMTFPVLEAGIQAI